MIDIAFTIEDGYSQHLAVTLASLKKTNSKRKINCHIIADFISESNKNKLKKTIRNSRIHLLFYEEQKLTEYGFKVDKHAKAANYYRLFIHDILPEYLNKILYLDSDILVLSDISECWEMDINKFAIAAVPSQNKKRSLVLNIDENRYFNSGVLLINLNYWRENNLTFKFIDFINNNSHLIKFWDQDVLNSICRDSVLFINKKWNYCGLFSDEHDVNILHFVGMHKPWSKHYKMNKNKKKYYKTLLKTPYWKFKYTKYLI